MTLRAWVVLLHVLLSGAVAADTPRDGREEGGHFDHEHGALTAVLGKYVREGWVDYAALHREGQPRLGRYLEALASVSADTYARFSREQKLAFWINAYNAYMLRLVLDHYPIQSVRSIGLLPGAAFRKSFISLPRLREGKLSLDDIEHEILRKELVEPRIHFAIVCASKSCPPLTPEAYRAKILDQQLDAAAQAFLRNPERNRFDGKTRTLHLSSIFKWFRKDFERAAGSLESFVARYMDKAVAAELARGGGRSPRHAVPPAQGTSVRIEFLEYDWSLNGR